MEYHSAIKQNKLLLTPATMWMDLKCIVFRERHQAQMANLLCDSICMTSLQRQPLGTEIRLVFARCWGWGRGLTTNGHEGTFWQDGNVLHLDCYMTVYTCQTHQIVHFKWWILLYVTYIHKPGFFEKSHMLEEADPFLSAFGQYLHWLLEAAVSFWHHEGQMPWKVMPHTEDDGVEKLLSCWINQP